METRSFTFRDGRRITVRVELDDKRLSRLVGKVLQNKCGYTIAGPCKVTIACIEPAPQFGEPVREPIA